MSHWRVTGENSVPMDVEAPTVVDAVAEAASRGIKLVAIGEVIRITAPGGKPTSTLPLNKYVPVAYHVGPVGGGEFKHGPFNHLDEALDIYPQEGDAIFLETVDGKQCIWATCMNGEWKAEKEN